MPNIFADVTNQRFHFRKYDWRKLTSNKSTGTNGRKIYPTNEKIITCLRMMLQIIPMYMIVFLSPISIYNSIVLLLRCMRLIDINFNYFVCQIQAICLIQIMNYGKIMLNSTIMLYFIKCCYSQA